LISVSVLDQLLADLTSGDETRAENAVHGLVELGEAAFPALRDLLMSADADQRWWGLRTLAQSPQTPAEWLLPFLDDPAPEVRQAAALGLCHQPDETATEPLVRALSDEDTMTSDLARNALVMIGKPAVQSLLEIPRDAAQRARINALRALAEIGDYAAIPSFMAALEEDSAMLQYWAEEGLERLGLNMVYLKPE
jgi:HEAT repeat protein